MGTQLRQADPVGTRSGPFGEVSVSAQLNQEHASKALDKPITAAFLEHQEAYNL